MIHNHISIPFFLQKLRFLYQYKQFSTDIMFVFKNISCKFVCFGEEKKIAELSIFYVDIIDLNKVAYATARDTIKRT